MSGSILSVFKANMFSTICWYKNNKWLLISTLIWPYLMTFLILALGMLYGNIEVFMKNVGVTNPALFALSSSAIAMSSLGVIDAVAGFTIYNRWLGTLPYILLTPSKTYKVMIVSALPESIIMTALTILAISPAAIYFEGLLGGLKTLIVLLFIYFGMLPLLGLSAIIASTLLIVKEESNILSSLVPFILLGSGIFYPIDVLPNILQLISVAMPIRYVVEASRLLALYSIPQLKLFFMTIYMLAFLTIAYNGVATLTIKWFEGKAKTSGAI